MQDSPAHRHSVGGVRGVQMGTVSCSGAAPGGRATAASLNITACACMARRCRGSGRLCQCMLPHVPECMCIRVHASLPDAEHLGVLQDAGGGMSGGAQVGVTIWL